MAGIPGLRAYRMLSSNSAATSSAEPALPATGTGPACWLHATDPAEYDALRMLAAQLTEMRGALQCLVSGGPAKPGPGESPRAIMAWLDRCQPQLIVLAGPVLPPNLIERAAARGIALMLVNATHAAAPGRWRWWPGLSAALLRSFAQIHARDEASAQAFTRQMRGTVPVMAGGALARFPPAAACNHVELAAMRDTLAGRPVWFAYSLPQDEADAALAAHAQALRRSHRLLMIIAPRDPRDGSALAARAAELGFACARRAPDEDITETTQIYIADAEDEPGLFLRLAQVSYLGGSLTRDSGTPSPLPAAALGSALVFGPHAGPEARSVLEPLRRIGGGRRIAAAGELGEAVSALLSPEIGAEVALKAWQFATEGSDTTYHLARTICDWMHLNQRGAA
ncbi:MAG: hypothetical protein JJU15_05905 [Pararhodobacter sp.]|nr:hypothetical protein [Pararhodobacter sp.]